jgi:hypothetical protein
MPGKRSTTPLFDLLQQGRGRGVEVRAPEPEFERPRAPAPAPAEGGSQGLANRFAEVPVRIVGGVVQMPLAYAAVALAVSLTAVLGAWTLGYRRGEGHAKSEQAMLESVMGPTSRIVEPDGSSDGGVGERPANGGNSRQDDVAPAGHQEPGTMPRFLVAEGGTNADPRQPRHNYLYLAAQLEADAARSAIDHLGSRGIEAFAEIDPRYLKRKNGPLYSLIGSKGVPSDEVRGEAANRYKGQLLAAGAAWKKAGGKWDFADAYWVRFDPEQGD